jgi:hypothetical protein
MKFRLQRVHYMPEQLQPGVLYVSAEFNTAAHLCACGCGTKIRTPLGPTEWSIKETASGPTLRPSVGNFQQACQSHYFITRGEVYWAEAWTPGQATGARRRQETHRRAYYDALDRNRRGIVQRLWHWLKGRN